MDFAIGRMEEMGVAIMSKSDAFASASNVGKTLWTVFLAFFRSGDFDLTV